MKMEIPEDMKVPMRRRDTSNPENIRWLLRNLQIQNGQHPHVERVMNELKNAIKKA